MSADLLEDVIHRAFRVDLKAGEGENHRAQEENPEVGCLLRRHPSSAVHPLSMETFLKES